MQIAMKSIHVNEAFNVRTEYDPKYIEGLATAIQAQGLLQPVVVAVWRCSTLAQRKLLLETLPMA